MVGGSFIGAGRDAGSSILPAIVTPTSLPTTASIVIETDGTTITARDDEGLIVSSGTSATTVLQAAIAALTTGGVLFVRAGTYSINDNLGISTDHVSVVGEGRATHFQLAAAANKTMFQVRASRGVSLRNFRVDGNKANQTGSTLSGIQVSCLSGTTAETVEDLLIENVWVDNWKRSGISISTFTGATDDDTVVNCRIVNPVLHDNDLYGLNTSGDVRRLVVENPVIYSNGGTASHSGIYAESGANRWAHDWQIIGGYIWGNGNGIGVASTASKITNLTVAGTHFWDHLARDIHVDGAAPIIDAVHCLPFVDATAGFVRRIALGSGATNGQIRGCYIETGESGAGTDHRAFDIAAADVTIEGCTVKSTHIGLALTGARPRLIANNLEPVNAVFHTSTTATDAVLTWNRITISTMGTEPTYALRRSNIGHTTEAKGTATLLAAGTSVAVTHGLAATPTRVVIAATSDPIASRRYWVSAKGATTFTITADSAPGTDVTFDWFAEV